ncbi:7737_t:CDS:2 [Funneliformis caledonium]|uniref:7737_t:CDS:1 n=1 Tax=Funneliformis caledonium TaxID=1117310 RepID=A0A9N9FQ61_9GLOM|nr:7737_t:CDS:2 [Funneliformis caledonium]
MAARIGIGLEKLNNKLTNLLEENENLKQQHKDLQKENRETLRINAELKEKLQVKDKQLEKLQQKVLNLENQKKEFEIISQTLEKSLEMFGLDEVNENNNKILEEKNKPFLGEQNNKKTTKFPLNNNNDSIQLAKNITNSSEHSWSSYNKGEIRIVVGLDFGTTYSGFAYGHVINPENIIAHDEWPECIGMLKTNTVLQYDNKYANVMSWGLPALTKRPSRRRYGYDNDNSPPVELFKLHLSDLPNKFKPELSIGYKKVITDYLREIGKVMKDAIVVRWPNSDFFKNVLLVLTFPAEYSENARLIMRECVFNAGLINGYNSTNLQFITEPEAAAIYCMKQLQDHDLEIGTNFMVVDCGGGTVDLTIRKLINRNQLGEITERSGDFCGSTYIDREFIMYLSRKVGHNAMEMLRKNNYGQMQYLIQEFIKRCKLPFTGVNQDFNTYDLDLEEIAPVIKQYITDENRKHLEAEDWLIELNFNDIKSMFDPVVKNVLQLIHAQLNSSPETCSAIVRIILFPWNPTTAIERGAVIYGLSSTNSDSNVIASRIIKYTYGVKVRKCWTKDDPIHRKVNDGRIDKFDCLVKRGTPMNVNQEIMCSYLPLYPTQTKVVFYLYYTKVYDAKYCDEPGMKLLGKLTMDLPGSGLDNLSFGLAFGQMEVTATVKNENNNQKSKINFEFDV